MKQVQQVLAQIDPPPLIAAVLLVLAVLLVIRIGRGLLLAATVGSLAGGVSLGQGSPPKTATAQAAIGFAVAVATLFLIRFTKSLPLRLLITAAGVGVLLLYGFGR
jgi:hypothetical protein